MDITPKWDTIPVKEKIISQDANFGAQIGGIGSPTVSSVKQTQTQVIDNTSSLNIAGWTSNLVFSSLDSDTVAWASGSIILKDGTTYSITGSNTGNMTAVTYIYFDINVSTTALQKTTTASSSVGTGKILIAVAQNNTDTSSEASFQVFGGAGGFMVTRNGIAANTITANEIAANTITSSQLTATAIDAMTVTGALIRTAASGTRVEMNGTDNAFKVYDGTNNIINIGSYTNATININLTSGGTTNSDSGIDIRSNVGGVGYRYINSSNVNSIGILIEQTGTTNNTNEALRIRYNGSYYAEYIDTSNSAGGILIDNGGTGRALYILNNSNSSTTPVEIQDDTYNSTPLTISQDGGGSGGAIKIDNAGSGGAVRITNTSGPSIDISDSGNFANKIKLIDSGTSTSSVYIQKQSSGTVEYLESNINSSNVIYGLALDINNAGSGGAYAFSFYGNCASGSSVGGSQNAKIKVYYNSTTYYIPLYTG